MARGRRPRGPPLPRRATRPAKGGRRDERSRLLLIGALVIDPVAALVRARVLAPRLRLDQALRARDDLELTVLEDLADEGPGRAGAVRSEEHTSELQSLRH